MAGGMERAQATPGGRTASGGPGGALAGALLLAIFAAGMAAPLFVLALVWDQLGTTARGRLRGREIQVGPLRRPSSVVISSLSFMSQGVAFVLFPASTALRGGCAQGCRVRPAAGDVGSSSASSAAAWPTNGNKGPSSGNDRCLLTAFSRKASSRRASMRSSTGRRPVRSGR